jgi:hypothetical protein
VIEPVLLFLTHPFGLSLIALAVVVAGLLAVWRTGRQPIQPARRHLLAAALPVPLLCAVATLVLLLVGPWDDPLIRAVLLTVGMLGTFFALMVGLLTAWLVVRWRSA